MSHATTTIDGHTVTVTGPDADGLAQRLAQAQSLPAGCVLVPSKPTFEQIMAASKAAKQYFDECGGNSPSVIYEAMLAASPAQPVQPSEHGHSARPDLNKFAHEHHWQRPDGSVYCVDSSD